MPMRGVSVKLIEKVENDTAIMLDAKDAILQLRLLIRAKHRRGYLDTDELHNAEEDLATLERAIQQNLEYTREARAAISPLVS